MSAGRRVAPPVLWVPTSYFAEGVAYAMVLGVAASMFKDFGHSDGEITLATGSISIVWSLKPLWAAWLDRYKTKKFFVLAMEILMAVLMGLCAAALRLPTYFTVIVALLWVTAFASATQDICVDGVYITSLDEKNQARWIGLQGTFWTVGKIFATGAVVALAGELETRGILPHDAWMYALGVAGAVLFVLAAYHYVLLPTGSPARDRAEDAEEVPTSPGLRSAVAIGAGVVIGGGVAWGSGRIIGACVGIGTTIAIIVGWKEHVPPFIDFFKKKAVWGMLLFVFLFRTGEGFLLAEGPLFVQASLADGGLGLSLKGKAFIDGTVSTAITLVAGILGGAFASRIGLRRALLPLAFFMNVPHLCYLYLAHATSPDHALPLTTILILVTIEKFGYSFGFVGNMLYMMQQLAPGKYKMTHYAYATALMNLVLVPTQAMSGPLADRLGYKSFFLFVLVASIPSILAAWKAPFPNKEEAGSGPSPSPAH
jgi:PAT family beta-lactamase induction signal transducer AmpG